MENTFATSRHNRLLGGLIVAALFIGFSMPAQARKEKNNTQNSSTITTPKAVSGVVKDEKGDPVIGANVSVRGTTNGTITDLDGNFNLEVTEGSTLLITYIGYTSKEVTVTKQNTYQIIIAEDTQNLEEVIVVGYGTVKRKDLTGSVARVDVEKYMNQASSQVTDMLAGTVAGFNVTQSSDASGGASSIQLRGPTSLKASTSPLIVLDGIIYNGTLKDINPKDIETVDILKDASSAAVYGSQAAAGVMIITTKRGKEGKPVINVSAQIGISDLTNKNHHAYNTGESYIRYRQDVMNALYSKNYPYYYSDPSNLPTGTSIEEWRKASPNSQSNDKAEWGSRLSFDKIELDNFLNNRTIDLFDMTFQNGLKQSYDASIRGGSERATYYWSLGYESNELVQKGNGYRAFRTRLNYDYRIADWLKMGINAQFADRNESDEPLSYQQRASPYSTIWNEDGSYEPYPCDYTGILNPFMDYTERDKYKRINTLQAALFAHITLPFGFKYEVTFQPRYSFTKDNFFWGADTWKGSRSYSQGYGERNENSTYGYLLDNLLRWNKKFGVHAFDATMLYNAEMNKAWASTMTGETFAPNSNLGWHALQQAAKQSIKNGDTESTGNAFMARLNYNLADKYMLTASVRRDGFSAFGKDNKYGIFPAFAAAWRISQEEFFKVQAISNLKLRLSWGINGNRSIGPYSALAQVTSGNYWNGSGLNSNIYNTTMANSSLRWEKTQSLNIGLDLSFLNNRINTTFDYYDMTTKDLLMDRQLPQLTGFKSIVANLGELGNTGFEMAINTVNLENKNFSWSSNFVFSLNRNKIKQLFGDYGEYTLVGKTYTGELPDYTNKWFPGHAVDAIWDYDRIGIFQQEEAELAAKYGLTPGAFKSVDRDGNFKYEEKIDKDFIGFTRPQFRLGLGNDFTFLKHWTASVFIRADLGHKARFIEAEMDNGYGLYRENTWNMPYWTPENRNNEWRGFRASNEFYGGKIQIFKSASFIRLQDVTLSYTLPEEASKSLKLGGLKFFGSIRNLLTISSWPGWDPESLSSPMPKTFSFGVNVTI